MKVIVKTDRTLAWLIDAWQAGMLRVDHEYQRGLKWSAAQKQMFIDSVFRGYSIPAFYFHERKSSVGEITNTFYDIVDGQQRIDAIYGYSQDRFKLADPAAEGDFRFPRFVKAKPCPWAGKLFGELERELQRQMFATETVIYQISDCEDDEIRDLFIRLQGGTPLTAQDKRDSWPGNFTEYVLTVGGKAGVERWGGHPMFNECAKGNDEKHRQLAAQIFMLFWTLRREKKFCDIGSSNLDRFYHQQIGFDANCDDAKRFDAVCNELHRAFAGQPKLAGHHLIHLVLLADALLDEYAPGWQGELSSALVEFGKRCSRATDDADKENPQPRFFKYWHSYSQWTRAKSADASTIQRRHAFFAAEMAMMLRPQRRDDARAPTEFERGTVFYRDRMQCQYCKMRGEEHAVAWDDARLHSVELHADAAAGVDNAALVHKVCHAKAGVAAGEFRQYWRARAAEAPVSPRRKHGKRNTLPPNGTKLRFTWQGVTYAGTIDEGVFAVTENHNGRYTSLSRAAGVIAGRPRNGWTDWEIRLPGERDWVTAAVWRERNE